MKRVGRELLGGLARLVLVEGLLRLLDEGQDVAEVEDAARHAVGVERLEVVEPLARRGEHDRPPGDRCDRERRATAGVAVELGEHDAGEVDALLEGARGGDRVLADHRVDDEQHLVGVDGLADVGGLLHQLGVDAEAAGGVDDDGVVLLALGLFDAVAGDLDRVADAVARLGREDGHAGLLADDLQLRDRVRALEVGSRRAAGCGRL